MPIMTMKRYTREYIRANPDMHFIFGDNYAREGLGGQAAAARGETNAVGICTKKAPTYNDKDFLTDKEYCRNITWILDDFAEVLHALTRKETVVWPEDGIGTGIADLPNRAPETLKFINTVIESLKKIYGEVPCA